MKKNTIPKQLPHISEAKTQQVFLRAAAGELNLTQKGLANRMGAPWSTFEKWLLPSESANSREMPFIAWMLVREILAHEKLKQKNTV